MRVVRSTGLGVLVAAGWLLVTIAVRDALPGPLGIVLGALWPLGPLGALFALVWWRGARRRRRLLDEEWR